MCQIQVDILWRLVVRIPLRLSMVLVVQPLILSINSLYNMDPLLGLGCVLRHHSLSMVAEKQRRGSKNTIYKRKRSTAKRGVPTTSQRTEDLKQHMEDALRGPTRIVI